MDKIRTPPNIVRDKALCRQPTEVEKKLGLWVERASMSVSKSPVTQRLRRLRLFAISAIREGSMLFYSKPTGWKKMMAGSVLIQFPDIPHTSGCDDNEFRDVCTLKINGPLLRTYQQCGLLSPERPFLSKGMKEVESSVRKLQGMMNEHHPAVAYERFHCINELLLNLYPEILNSSSESTTVSQIKSYIHTHAHPRLGVEDVTSQFTLSASQLRRSFKQETGSTIKQYIMQTCITRAQNLLLELDDPIKVIASQIGFDDLFHFMRVFKQICGLTPGQYRQKHA